MPINSMTRRTILLTGSAAVSFGCSRRSQIISQTEESDGKWSLAPALPYAVQEIYPTLHNGNIHLVGGFISRNGSISGATAEHIIFDPIVGTWTASIPLPTARHHPNLISFADRLLAIGGFEVHSSDAVWVMQSGVWAFDGETWSTAPDLPQPNGESVVGVLEDNLHVCGGRLPVGERNAAWTDHSDVSNHFVLSDLQSQWETAAPLPTARNSAASALLGTNWHVMGGRTVADGNTGAHEVYDLKEDRWRSAAPMPLGQGGLAAASVNGKLYAFGGEFFDNGGGVYPNSWSYDPFSDSWTALPDMPHPRHGLGAVAIGNEIFLIGGALEVGGSQTSNLVEVFTPSS